MHGLTRLVTQDQSVQGALEAVVTQTTGDLVAMSEVRPFLVAAWAQQRPVLIVASTYREAESITEVMEDLVGSDRVAYYPAWETLPHERLSPRSDTVGRRLDVLRRLGGNGDVPPPRVIVAPVRSLLQPQVQGLATISPVLIRVGEDHSIEDLTRVLVEAGYVRSDLVERRGEFAVRGGILDIFTPVAQTPMRIEFFGDTVDEIRGFSVGDQRSSTQLHDEILAVPCRELMLTEEVRRRARDLIPHHPGLTDMLDRIADGHAVEGMEALAPVLTDGMELLTDVVDSSTIVLIWDPEMVSQRAQDLTNTSQEFLNASWVASASGGQAPIDLGLAAYKDLSEVRNTALARGLTWWTMAPYGTDDTGVVVEALPHRLGQKDPHHNVSVVKSSVELGETVVVSSDSSGLAHRFLDVFTLAGIPAVSLDSDELPTSGQVSLVTTRLLGGFLMPRLNLSVTTSLDVVGEEPTAQVERKLPSRRKKQIDPLSLHSGDFVVHDAHGVGRYVEMATRTISGIEREYLVIEYAPSKKGQPCDQLHVPMDHLHKVSAYVGGEAPRLDRLGGTDWSRRKSRAQRAVREIAQELVRLYAARQAVQGFAFSPDTQWQREMEDSFIHIETPDQLSCIDEVKADMESSTPMDRLVCGDVGYGKTEIAVRAAFKAVMDGKQVAVLVPTTLLVRQHSATFASRFAGFPMTVASLSRFASPGDERNTVAGLASGDVDVVIGTHRLLSSDVSFKDLGLVIIDEEQRFGVDHKETLKKLRLDADVLTLSATPIPRTLEMGITGIRELSVIQTPPEERHPVLTFAGAYDEGLAVSAIRRELAREGQVFFIHNRVSSINQVASRLADLVPEARISVAHGQMSERALEQVMEDYLDRRSDILVCTTIVESGLDITNANTLIVDRADAMGLSQLHQIRGRVGRGRDRGYAYFFYPKDKQLSEVAHDRLATMAAHTDLGSGMRIAMRDLEIRGAGNLLGSEQSGHIAEVGFDLYLRLVAQAVSEFRDGVGHEPEVEMRIDIPVDAHLPTSYIDSERLRLELYRRIAGAAHQEDLVAITEELQDRFGEMPPEVLSLLSVAEFRIYACQAGVREVVSQGKYVKFTPANPLPDSRLVRMNRIYPGSIVKPEGHFLIPAPVLPGFKPEPVKNTELLRWARDVVDCLFTSLPGNP
ncbi:MAG: transcription-repair coupling factor [Propionibacteriaceae bacterium]|nr:transcription-repair coupling factor [Propionibacteriaceae bacterium]